MGGKLIVHLEDDASQRRNATTVGNFYDARKRRPPDMTNILWKTMCTRAYIGHHMSPTVINVERKNETLR